MLGPADIGNVRFATTRVKEGYDQTDVDNFLDRVRDALTSRDNEIERLTAENARLQRQNAEIRRNQIDTQQLPALPAEQPVTPEPPEAQVSRLLALAQRTADELLAEANREAEEYKESALVAAAHTRSEAEREAENVRAEATTEADEKRRRADAEAYRAQQELDRLVELRNSTRAYLESQLKALHNKLGDV